MNLPGDLDAWTARLQTETGITATRDPALILPPCLFVDLPTLQPASTTGYQVAVSVWLVAPGAGKADVDPLLALLPKCLDALPSKWATPEPLTVGGQTFPTAYKLDAQSFIWQPDPE